MKTNNPYLHHILLFAALSMALLFPLSKGRATELSTDGYKEITAPELKAMKDSGRDVLIINVLSKIEYDIQHVSGSINIPIVKMMSTDDLPGDKKLPIVFHCLSDR